MERPKLRFFDKVPQYPPNLKPPKMQKRLRYMRGPEMIHTTLQHEQYGIQAMGGGRMRWGHFEMLRLSIGRKMDVSRMFSYWRIDAPWQPGNFQKIFSHKNYVTFPFYSLVTRRGQGQRLGGGKGAIDHYVTPVKSGRIILEFGGRCEFKEVQEFLQKYADQLPFPARAVSHEMLEKERERKEELERINLNPYTFKYVTQNNLSGCHKWLRPIDHKQFGKFE